MPYTEFQSCEADRERERDFDRDGERDGDRLEGDLEWWRSSRGEGEREGDFLSPFSIGEAERLRDFLLTDFSLERLREPRSDRGFEWLLERDLRLAERLRDLRERERERDFLERDLAGDLERDFLLDLELERRLLRDRELLTDRINFFFIKKVTTFNIVSICLIW